MESTRKSNLDFGAIGWGALFIWWGFTELYRFLPDGAGAIGVGLILLGVNVARSLTGSPTSGFSIALGLIALALGGLELANSVFHLPFELPVFPIILLAFGAVILVRALLPGKK
jgi:hypothetical protein